MMQNLTNAFDASSLEGVMGSGGAAAMNHMLGAKQVQQELLVVKRISLQQDGVKMFANAAVPRKKLNCGLGTTWEEPQSSMW